MAFEVAAEDYTGLVEALRIRAEQLGISRLCLDDLAGLASGHAGKLLGRRHVKRFGLASLGPTLAALGLRLIVVEDSESISRYGARIIRRTEFAVRHVERTEAI